MNRPETPPTAEVLILPDGTVLAHNLPPEVASLLRVLNPDDTMMAERARAAEPSPLPS